MEQFSMLPDTGATDLIPITPEQECLIRSDETTRYIDTLRLRYHQTNDQAERKLLSEMIGAAESVLAIWLTPMQHFWDE